MTQQRDAKSLETVCREIQSKARPLFEKGELMPFRINSQQAPIDREWPKPPPDEIKTLWRYLQGIHFDEDTDVSGPRRAVFLLDWRSCEWIDAGDKQAFFGEEFAPWLNAEYFWFGHSYTGDGIAFCPRTPDGRRNCILLLDLEGSGPERDPSQPQTVVVLGHSLAKWLQRWSDYDFIEYSWSIGTLKDLPRARQLEFLRSYHDLNPTTEWALKRIEELNE